MIHRRAQLYYTITGFDHVTTSPDGFVAVIINIVDPDDTHMGGSELNGVSEHGTTFRMHAVEQLLLLYTVSAEVNVSTDSH